MSQPVMHCMERKLSDDQKIKAARLAIMENPENGNESANSGNIENLEMALEVGKKWRNGRILRVRFLDGVPFVHEKVKNYANQWSRFANIKFVFGNDSDAEVRISFKHEGYWSYVGTDNLTIAKNEATMNFEGFNEQTEESEFSRVVLHEFGHLIGVSHEQSSPAANIPWDIPAVYEHYRVRGWSKQDVDHNVLAKMPFQGTSFSRYDPLSIMQYPVPNELTIGDFEIGWNTTLSELDKQFIGRMYPLGHHVQHSDRIEPSIAAAAMHNEAPSSFLENSENQ